jgi:hypothetical protein
VIGGTSWEKRLVDKVLHVSETVAPATGAATSRWIFRTGGLGVDICWRTSISTGRRS